MRRHENAEPAWRRLRVLHVLRVETHRLLSRVSISCFTFSMLAVYSASR